MKSILKQIAWTILVGILLAAGGIAIIERPPPITSQLDDAADRIHIMNHQLDDLLHLYDQALGCRVFVRDVVLENSPEGATP